MHRELCALSFSLGLLSFSAAGEVGWNQFRGPNCGGSIAEAEPPLVFGPTSNLVFKVEVGAGASSPCVVNGRVFLTTRDGAELRTVCLDANDGGVRWSRSAPGEKLEAYQPSEGSPAASTSATDGQHVVSYFGSRGVFCYEWDGALKWEYRLEPAQHIGAFGTGTSVALIDGQVLINRDQAAGSKLIALDAKTGKLLWEAQRPDLVSSYSTPVVWENGGNKEVVVAGSIQMRAYDFRTGVERWRVRGLPPVTCTTPVMGDGLLFFAGWANGKAEAALEPGDQFLKQVDKDGDGRVTRAEFDRHPKFKGFFDTFNATPDDYITREEWEVARAFLSQGENCLIAIGPGGKGDITESHVRWKQTRGLPYVPSPVYYRGNVYLVKDGGLVSCFDGATGKPHYQEERLGAGGTYYSSPVIVKDRLYMASVSGKITVVRTGPNPEVLSRTDLGERLVASPALAGKSIFFRTANHLWKFQEI